MRTWRWPAWATTVQPAAAPAQSAGRVCAHCRHRTGEPAMLERRIPGLVSFSSGFGANVGDSRLCLEHDRLVSPHDKCARFAPAQ